MDNVMSGTGKWSLGYVLLDQQWSLAGHLTPFVDDLDSYSSGWRRLLEMKKTFLTKHHALNGSFEALINYQTTNWYYFITDHYYDYYCIIIFTTPRSYITLTDVCLFDLPSVKWSHSCVTYRFDDPFLPGAAVLPGFAEQLDVLRKDEGPGKKAELLFAKATLHLRQVPPQPVLSANLKRSREVVQLGMKETQTPAKLSVILVVNNFAFLKVKASWEHELECVVFVQFPTFWCSPRALKPGDFIWCPQQPSQSWLSTRTTPTTNDFDHPLFIHSRKTSQNLY